MLFLKRVKAEVTYADAVYKVLLSALLSIITSVDGSASCKQFL